MHTLHVLYDQRCAFCRLCRRWLESQPAHLRFVFHHRDSTWIERRLPGLIRADRPDEIVVVSDDGGVYRGTSAYLICLWALKRYRRWSHRLARPSLRPAVRGVLGYLARHRYEVSKALLRRRDDDLLASFTAHEPPRCAPVIPPETAQTDDRAAARAERFLHDLDDSWKGR